MPNIKSAVKRCRTSEASRVRNRSVKREINTVQRNLEDSIAKGDRDASTKRYSEYCAILDKAVKKGVVTANLSARGKSRKALKLNAM